MINVKDQGDGSFIIEWDENDPQESIFNDWTKEDFIQFFEYAAKREFNLRKDAEKSGEESQETSNISEATEKDYQDFWEGDDISEQEIDQDNWYKVKRQEIDQYLKDTNEQTFGQEGYPTKDDRLWEG